MPLGYYKVEETTVPTGYTVDNAITIKQGEAIVSKNGMFEMTAASYSAKYVASSSEKPETGKLSLYKESSDKKQLTIMACMI